MKDLTNRILLNNAKLLYPEIFRDQTEKTDVIFTGIEMLKMKKKKNLNQRDFLHGRIKIFT